MKRDHLILASLVVVSGALAYTALYPREQPKSAPASPELMSRVVTNCDLLAREIEDMTQTTAELRKVLRDMEFLTCASARPPKGATDFLPDIPRCGLDAVAVFVDNGAGTPGWACQPQIPKDDSIR